MTPTLSSATLAEIKALKQPDDMTKTTIIATMIALGCERTEALKTIQRHSSTALAAKLLAFEPSTLTPAQMMQIRPLVEMMTPTDPSRPVRGIGLLAQWLTGVYEAAKALEDMTTNYALLHEKLKHTPLGQLRRFQRAVPADPIPFCWRAVEVCPYLWLC
jgi:hypothetical protein